MDGQHSAQGGGINRLAVVFQQMDEVCNGVQVLERHYGFTVWRRLLLALSANASSRQGNPTPAAACHLPG